VELAKTLTFEARTLIEQCQPYHSHWPRERNGWCRNTSV